MAEKHRGLERELAAAADEGVVETLVADAVGARAELAEVARERGCSPVTVAYAWLLREPCGAVPVVSSSRAAGLREAAAGTDLELDRQEWFALLAAASGQPVA